MQPLDFITCGCLTTAGNSSNLFYHIRLPSGLRMLSPGVLEVLRVVPGISTDTHSPLAIPGNVRVASGERLLLVDGASLL